MYEVRPSFEGRKEESEHLMAQSFEDKIREYRTAASQKAQKKARAEAELDAALARETQAREALKAEFGVETNEEAKELAVKLQAEITEKQAEIEVALAEAGA